MGVKVLVGIPNYKRECPKARTQLIEKGYELIELPRENPYSKQELLELAPEVDGSIAGLEPWCEEVFAACKKLKGVSRFGVGYDTVDLAAAKKHGVIVTNVRSAVLSNGVAEFAVSLMLSCAKNLVPMHNSMAEGRWARLTGCQLYGKTVGIVGFGAIGKSLARILQGFKVRILAYDVYQDTAAAAEYGVTFASKETILKESDFISLHIPSAKENFHFIGARELALMKKTAVLINTARGMVLDTAALHEALKERRIKAAGLDVFETEPPGVFSLCGLDNVVLQPHASGENSESKEDVSVQCARNLIEIIEGRIPKTALNV